MSPQVQAFFAQKHGNAVEDYEDAFAVQNALVAVADGATESSFAQLWAKLLAEGFTQNFPLEALPNSRQWQQWLEPLQEKWRGSIKWDSLPWFAVDKAKSGALSSLTGLQFREEKQVSRNLLFLKKIIISIHWRSIAIGDSCLFLVRSDNLVKSFPMSRSEDFGNTPFLLSSNVSNNERVWNEVYTDDGECFDDDVFFLVTDALAHWFLAQKELGNKPWNQLLGIKTQEDFICLVHRLRQERLLRNDDTTLLIVRLVAKSTQSSNTSQGTGKHETIGI